MRTREKGTTLTHVTLRDLVVAHELAEAKARAKAVTKKGRTAK